MPPTSRGLENVRILAVEDQDDSRDLLQFVLQREGAIVETARSVPEAKAALGAKPFDVLVADLGLPDEDGYSLIRAIRQTFPSPAREIRAVALTAYAGDYYRSKALEAGYDAYVAKPLEPPRLLEVLRGLIGRTNGSQPHA
ncbi:MAG TPA: response regulator [Vicinamibacterales bacterium]|nr:response regulator [Vicinamibacterales bacterium]